MNSLRPKILSAVSAALFLLSGSTFAQTTHWLGRSSNWNDSVNWDKGVPADTTATIISLGSSGYIDPYVPAPVGSDTASTGDLTVQSGAKLYFVNSPPGVLVVHGTAKLQNNAFIYLGGGQLLLKNEAALLGGGVFRADSGTITLEGSLWDFKSGASFDAGTSTAILQGSGNQTVSGNVTFYNLIVNTPDTVTISGRVSVKGNLTVGAGAIIVIPPGDSLAVEGTVINNGTIVGNYLTPVFGLSTRLLNFGKIREGKLRLDSVTVENTGSATLNISSVSSTLSDFFVYPATASVPPAASHVFQVTFSPTSLGLQTGSIIFVHDGSKTHDTLTVEGSGVMPEFSVASSGMDLGNVFIGKVGIDSLYVRNAGTDTLHLDSLQHFNVEFTVKADGNAPYEIAPGDSKKVSVTFTPTALGSAADKLIFYHDAPGLRDTVFITGVGVETHFAVNPVSVVFENTILGSTRKDSIVVTNDGNAQLLIDSVHSDNALFAVFPTSARLDPSGTMKFFVSFTPTGVGGVAGNIVFHHNAATGWDSVKLSGTGTQSSFAVLPASLEFGGVLSGGSMKDSVVVTNGGSALLTVDSVRSDNAMFIVSPTGRTTISPAAARTFYVTFSPTSVKMENGNVVFYHSGPTLWDTVRVRGTGTQAAFAVLPTSLDFGEVLSSETKKDSVVVTNGGSAVLTIDSVRSNNVVFLVSPTGGTTISPAAARTFYVTFSPTSVKTENGNVVFYHSGLTSRDTVKVSGTGTQSSFDLLPASLAFGGVLSGQSKKDSVVVTNGGSAALKIDSVRSDNGVFVVSPTTSAVIAPTVTGTFYITFSPTSASTEKGNIVFYHSGPTTRDTAKVSGTGTQASIGLAPTTIAFGGVLSGESKKDSVVVSNNGSANLTIDSVRSNNVAFVVSPTAGTSIAPAATESFYVTFNPTSAKTENGDLVFYHSGPTSRDTVKVSGTGTQAAFALAPTSLVFSAVLSGHSKTDSVMISNSGSAALTIDSVRSDNRSFAVAPSVGGTIAPAETSTFYITFNPTGVDTARGNIVFYHNGPTLRDTVKVRGIGREATLVDTYTEVPKKYELFNNYPNPFNPSTTILYGLPQQSRVTVKIYSILGQEVRTLVDEIQNASFHHVQWNGTDDDGSQVSSGVYFFRIDAVPLDGKTNPFSRVMKMVLMK